MSNKEIIVVTGATRGIGAQLVKQLSKNLNVTVIATVRDIESVAAKKLIEQSSQPNQDLRVLQINSAHDTDPFIAAEYLQNSLGITHVDVVIANAGSSTDMNALKDVKLDNVRETFNVNAVAPIALFQAFEPFLQKSNHPRIVFMSSAIGSKGIQHTLPYRSTSYGTSKAALNFIALRIAIEHPNIISIAVHPGLVSTELGSSAQSTVGSTIEDAVASGHAITPEESVNALLKLVGEATISGHSGKFFNAPTGVEIPW